MSKDKKPFLTVDYSKATISDEVREKQEKCSHSVLAPIGKEILVGNYRELRLVEYHCVECNRIFIKEMKNKK